MGALWRLRSTVRAYWLALLLTLIIVLALTGVNLAVPAVIRQVIDRGLTGGDRGYLPIAAGILLGLGTLRALLGFGQRYLSEWVAAHIGYDLRNRLYNHIQHLSFSFHDHAQTGQLISRTIEDVRAIERFTGSGLVELVRLAILLVAVLGLLIASEPRLALIASLPLIPLVLLTTRFGSQITQLFLVVDQTLGELSSRLQENVSGVQVVRAFAREDYEIERFAEANQAQYDARLTVLRNWGRVLPTSLFLVTLGTILMLLFGGELVIRGQLTLGTVVAFNSYLLLLAAPAQQLTWVVNAAGEAAAGAARTFEILDTPPAIVSPPDAVRVEPLAGRVEFRAVSFTYARGGPAALQALNLVVEPNQRIALVGPTGSGKTSLINLIPRFYDVSAGAVLIDGVDVRQFDLPCLRRQIGIVLQTSLLFSDTLHANIAFGRPEASRAQVIAAAQAAQADEFIRELPNGYDTVVGERGVTLSGGQRQRIAIARALLLDPRILILDDSTSSVDTQTERLLQAALTQLMQGRTTFVIAHRLSTVQRADLILVLDGGRIVARGTHAELIADSTGLYRQIVDLQLRPQESLAEGPAAALGSALAPDGERPPRPRPDLDEERD